jgi:hypothetical protein
MTTFELGSISHPLGLVEPTLYRPLITYTQSYTAERHCASWM